jgi:hypothetical protein
MAKIEVLSRRRIFSPVPTRVGKSDVVVLYRVNGDPTQTFFVTVPEEELSDARIQTEIRKAEAERLPTAPQSFDI